MSEQNKAKKNNKTSAKFDQNSLYKILLLWEQSLKSRILRLQTHESTRELIWTIAPTIILLLIAIPSIELLYLLDTMDRIGPVLNYKVIGHQWYWSYNISGVSTLGIYGEAGIDFDSYMLPEEDVIAMEGLRLLEVTEPLIVPIQTNIHVLVTSADVIHSWAVPSLGVKIDAVPGRINHICMFIKRPGTFYGQCSEICGVNHAFMPIKVIAVDVPYGLDGNFETAV